MRDKNLEDSMIERPSYAIVRLSDGRLRLDRTTPTSPTTVGYAKPVTDRQGSLIGWKLQPIVVLRGSASRVWPTPADALASTRLLTAAAARRLIDDATAASTDGAVR
jgi:hypothetical protein